MNRFFIIFCLFTATASAQDGHYGLGARNNAVAGSSSTFDDHWSIFNNVGAIGSIHETTAFLSYQNRYNISSFSVIGGGFIHSTRVANIGVKYFKFGDDLFSQQLVGFAAANRFQMVSLGLGVNVIQTAAEGLQTQQKAIFELGGLVEISSKLYLGAHIFNLKNSDDTPTVMKAGLSYLPITTLRLNVEIEKQLEIPEKIKAGMEYQVISLLFLRTGISVHRSMIRSANVWSSFGFGFRPGSFLIDYAFINGGQPGSIHEISLSYQITK